MRGTGGDWSATPARELTHRRHVVLAHHRQTSGGRAAVQDRRQRLDRASNCGAAAGGLALQLATPSTLLCDSNSGNIDFAPPSAGDYTFSLKAADKVHPVLTVGKAAPFGATTMYVRGGVNDWGNGPSPTAPMAWDGVGKYRAAIVNLPASTFDFVVADADWTGASNAALALAATSWLLAPRMR